MPMEDLISVYYNKIMNFNSKIYDLETCIFKKKLIKRALSN